MHPLAVRGGKEGGREGGREDAVDNEEGKGGQETEEKAPAAAVAAAAGVMPSPGRIPPML